MLAIDEDGLAEYTEQEIKDWIAEAYCESKEELDKFDILISREISCGYEEWSYYLLHEKATGKLFENHASHCSCYGFEGQWEPEETTLKYLFSKHYEYRNDPEIMSWILENLKEEEEEEESEKAIDSQERE